jgi:hypothetical protein
MRLASIGIMFRRKIPLVVAALTLSALALSSGHARAEEESESPAMSKNRGLRVGLAPVLLIPTDRGPMGGGLELDGRYGIKAGPTVLAPGGMLAGYIISLRPVGIAMPTARLTLPAGPLAPFIMGGVGGGWLGNPAQNGLAVMGGGGMAVHFWRIVAIGAELSYQTITGTEFRSLALGPVISFGG